VERDIIQKSASSGFLAGRDPAHHFEPLRRGSYSRCDS